MEQRVSLITLGVRNPARAATFYETLGWQRVDSPDGVIAFDLIGQVLGLYPLEALADEIGLAVDTLGQGAITLSYNCRTKSDVAEVLIAAEGAGAEVLKPAQDVFWGGHHGYFRAPDGTIWEVAHNPFSGLRDDGAFCWNGY
ncbi:VOC family protein [Falsiruegeria litorea]|nr:VOC family protein [Falsiruegeria litorea]